MKKAALRRLPSEKVEELFQEALGKGLKRDEFSVGVYLQTAAKLRQSKKVAELLQEYQAFDSQDRTTSFNIRLNVAILQRQWEEADKILEEMATQKVPQNLRTYNHRLQLASYRRDDEAVKAIREEMKRLRIKLNGHIASTLIEHAGNGGTLADIDTLLGELREANGRITPRVVVAILEAFLKQRQWTTVIERFDKYKDHLRPSISAIEAVLEALSKARNIEKLESILQEMDRQGVFKTVKMKASIADAYQRAGDFEKAWSMLSELSHSKNFKVLKVALSACGNHQKLDLLDELVSGIEKDPRFQNSSQSLSLLSLVINAYMKAGSVPKAAKFMLSMKERGIRWDSRHRSAFINSLKAGDFPESLTASVQQLGMSKEREVSDQEAILLEEVLNSVVA